ncbi:MAG: response regulator transcription factor [Bacteroidales bacterium]
MKQRIVIVENSEIIAAGIIKILEASNDFTVVAHLTDIHQFEHRQSSLRPNIVIINNMLVDYTRRHSILESLKVSKVAIESACIEPETARHYDAIISIYDSASRIENKLRLIISNEKVDSSNSGDSSELSDREKEILVSVATGMMNKEIADQYNISIHTVISHRKNITRKTGIKSVSGLTVYAMLNNLIGADGIK